jgi:MoaA/NifB/PqqE/SkfB family radical SAM enzyme
MSVNLCTNGMLVEKYRRQISESGATCVTVSLDGATADRHDDIRGMAGSWRQIERGVISFLEQRSDRMPILRVRMTVSNANADEIRQFYERWHGVADDVLFQPVHHCTDSYYTGLHDAALSLDASVISDQLHGTPMARDPYMRGLLTSLNECGAYPFNPCYAGVLMARIDPWGNVYPCLEQHTCVGSVRSAVFSAIWNSKPFNEERKRLASSRNCRCWYNNTALIGHFGTLIKNTISGRKRCSSRSPQAVSP